MAEFAYNNAKNISTSHTPFELNYGSYPENFYENNVDPHFQSKSANEMAIKLQEQMMICKITSNMYKSSKNNFMINMQSVIAITSAKKFS